MHTNFAGDQETLDVMFHRFEKLFEVLNGHMLEIILAFREQSDLDIGPIMPFDRVLAAYNPGAHIDDDFFANKLAFTVLLNFPLTTLEQRLTEGETGAVDSGPRLAGQQLQHADPGRGPAGGLHSRCDCRRVHRRVQHLDAPSLNDEGGGSSRPR